MKYADIREYDIANGEGIRTVLFVSGCTHNCRGCFNALYQDFNYGKEFTEKEQNLILDYFSKKEIKGLTLLGGEPMQNVEGLLPLLQEIDKLKKQYKSKDIEKDVWLYSGYTFEEICLCKNKRRLLDYIDVLVDGKFIQEQLDLRLAFRGSSNQRIIDVAKSIEKGIVMEIEKYN